MQNFLYTFPEKFRKDKGKCTGIFIQFRVVRTHDVYRKFRCRISCTLSLKNLGQIKGSVQEILPYTAVQGYQDT